MDRASRAMRTVMRLTVCSFWQHSTVVHTLYHGYVPFEPFNYASLVFGTSSDIRSSLNFAPTTFLCIKTDTFLALSAKTPVK